MTKEDKENRIQEIRRELVQDEGRPHGDARDALLAELHDLEQQV